MKLRFSLLVILMAGLFSFSAAQSNWVGINRHQPAPADAKLVQSNIETSRLQFSLEGYQESLVETPKGKEAIISIEDGVQILEKGQPDLAKLVSTIIIPDHEKMEVSVIKSKYEEIQDVDIAPSKGHFDRNIRPGDVPYTYGEAYDEDAFWPGDLAQLEEPFIMRDFRGQAVTIFPFQYNPVSKTLRVYTDIVVEVTSTTQEGQNPKNRTREEIVVQPEFNEIYNRFFLNMEAASKSYPLLEGEEGSMLIIAYDDFMEAMEPFVDWKRTTGRQTEMVSKTEAGNTPNEIKSYVEDYYDDNEDFTHLLIVGDGPQIQPMSTSWGHSDNAYGFLEGDDSFNEIFVGRFSAENVGHVETQVQRMIEYERDLNENDNWLANGMGIARNEGSGHYGESDDQHMDLIRDTLLNFTYGEVHRHYESVSGMPDPTPSDISNDVEDGVSTINFCNHGSTTGWSVAGYNISHVNQLDNVGKLPYIQSVACVNGNFVNNFCFAEAWLRATHDGEPAGAVGMMAATINQPWHPPMCGQDEMVSIKTEASIEHGPTIKRTYGGVSINGSMFMIPQHGSQGVRTHETWILFGDPSLLIRTDTPTPINATYNPVILLGTNFFDITVDNADGSTVAISQYDEAEQEVIILGTATIENGSATVNFEEPPEDPGEVTLAITGFNKETYINEEIQVIPPDGPYVIFDDFLIDDSQGNNNNQADYGEFIQLDVSLENVGIETAEGVEAHLSTESEYVTLIDDHNVWGDIEDDSDMHMEGAFSLEVDEVIPDGHSVLFTLEVTDAEENEWESNFSMNIYAPEFEIGNFWVDDSEHGDDNGRLDPGEKADLIISYTNTGGAPAMSPLSAFHADSPYLTIIEGDHEHDVIPSGETIDVHYTVEAHPSTIEGTFVDALFAIEDAKEFDSDQELIIGQTPEVVLGDGDEASDRYPFYNFYRANRSQMLYLNDELGAGEKTITELAFDIVNASSSHNELPSFFIRMKHTDAEELSAFEATGEDDVVFSADPYEMPVETGWHLWELQEHFEYDGESNLLVEIVWGRLPNWTSDNYEVASTEMDDQLVAYGYSDSQDVPSFSGTTSVRANLWLTFAADDSEEAGDVQFLVMNQEEQLLEDARVTVGSAGRYTDEEGTVSYSLLPGDYAFSVVKDDYQDYEETLEADGDMTIEVVMLPKSFPVTFHVDLSRAIQYDLLAGFDPEAHHVMITGDMFEWAAPGEGPEEQIMEKTSEDPLIFSQTLDLEPGEYTYKYFSDLIGEGWDGGEWDGEPNRIIEVEEEEMIVEEMFGPDDLPVTDVSNPELSVYPNPASSSITAESNEIITHIQIIDMLGQVVYNAQVQDQQKYTIDVSGLNSGMYFIQVSTANGMVTHKAQVTR